MIAPGSIVLVDWRDALPGTGEPNKLRPAVVIGSPRVFGFGLPFEIVVPLTGESALCIADAATTIEPSAENGCRKTCYLLAWNVQSVPHARLRPTPSRISATELATIRTQVALCVGAEEPV
jgi:mRNA-degrading endonuclease toxin of MazEF toxin-antitoxin module